MENSNQPQASPRKGFFENVSSNRFFAKCAGIPNADYDGLSEKEKLTYAKFGKSLFVPTIVAMLGAYCVLTDVYSALGWVCLIGCLVYAWIIFTIDSGMTMSMSRNRAMRYSPKALLLRFALAFALGIMLSTVLELRIFKDEIRQEYSDEGLAAKGVYDKLQEKDIAEIQSRIDAHLKEVRADKKLYDDEVDKSIGGRQAGDGPVAKKKYSVWHAADSIYRTKTLPQLEKEIADKKDFYEKKRDVSEANFSDGLASRVEYLFAAGRRHPLIGYAHWFIFLFLLTLELIPVMTKMMAPITEYEIAKAKKLDAGLLDLNTSRLNTIESEKMLWEKQAALEDEKKLSNHRFKMKLDEERISHIVNKMQLIHDAATKMPGRSLDAQFEAVSDEMDNIPSDQSRWFWKR